MGSGSKFRIEWLERVVSLGITVGRMCEHEWSIHVCLIKIQFYIGIGKGYEEFKR